MSNFNEHNWEDDTRWHDYKKTLEMPSGLDEAETMKKMKLRYWKKYMDANYDPNPSSKPSQTPTSSSPSSSNSSNTNSNSGSSTSSNRPRPASSTRANDMLQYIWLMAQMSAIVCAICYILPFFSIQTSYTLYRTAFYSATLAHALSLYKSIGIPTLNREGLMRFTSHESSQYIILYVLLSLNYPITVTLFPVVIYALFHVISTILRMTRNLPVRIRDLVERLEPQIRSIQRYESQAIIWAAQLEVASIVLIIINWFSGLSSLPLIICYGAFLNYRYIMNYATRMTLDALGMKLDSIFHGPMCPSVISLIYGKIRGYLRMTIPNVQFNQNPQ